MKEKTCNNCGDAVHVVHDFYITGSPELQLSKAEETLAILKNSLLVAGLCPEATAFCIPAIELRLERNFLNETGN